MELLDPGVLIELLKLHLSHILVIGIGRVHILKLVPSRRNPRKDLLDLVFKKFLRPLAQIFWSKFKILNSLDNSKSFLLPGLSQLVQ